MKETIAQIVHDAGQKIATTSGSLADALNDTLNQLLPWPFRASKGSVMDSDGETTEGFATVIHTAAAEAQTAEEPCIIDADNVACVIDVDESYDTEKLGAAYERIARAKNLKKTPLPHVPGAPSTTVTLGIVFARESADPLQHLAEELDRLNSQHEDSEWTDMVVVLSKGVVNYAVQFPGEGVTGDFLPPAEGALAAYSPPIYVVLLARPTARFTFNKMCSFLFGHLMFFSPGARLADWNGISDGTPDGAIAITGYQYNLSGRLMPVPPEFYNDRYLPPRPFLIEDGRGQLLSTLQFLPWQDGGVVLLQGKLPLNPFLIFLGQEALSRGGVVNRPKIQVSYVLPIGQTDFAKMLERIHRQSNMVVKQDPSTMVVQKFMDEGSRQPFIARLYIGVLRLRDVVFPDRSSRGIFDGPYLPVLEALVSARNASRAIPNLLAAHSSKLASGDVGKLRGHNIYIEETIDEELRRGLETFLNSSVRALKHGMQSVTKALGKDIGFLFKKRRAFEEGLETLEKSSDRNLGAYLREVRKWSELLINSRNAIEHEGWILPKVRYSVAAGVVHSDEPEISGQKISEFAVAIMDRLNCFVEEVAVHCLAAQMPSDISITEVPLSQREPDMPLRFQLALQDDGIVAWRIVYHESPFDEA